MERKELKRLLFHTAKIAVGSSAAIFTAELLHLEYAALAGSIALLTLVTTKWETLWLSAFRVITFLASASVAWLMFSYIRSEWVAYGAFIFILVLVSELLGQKATISINAVIGTHFLSTRDFSPAFLKNEFFLVLIGISIAILLNLYHNNSSRKKEIISNMRITEQQLQMILKEMAFYLQNQEQEKDVWEDVGSLNEQLRRYLENAYEYQNNTFQSHPAYYIDYFEMRIKQCSVLYSLHDEMKKIRTMPEQAQRIAQYILYVADHVTEVNVPAPQLERLEEIFAEMKKELLPVTREEFEGRAMLYHILMDLEEFLISKECFVNALEERQLERYWRQDHSQTL